MSFISSFDELNVHPTPSTDSEFEVVYENTIRAANPLLDVDKQFNEVYENLHKDLPIFNPTRLSDVNSSDYLTPPSSPSSELSFVSISSDSDIVVPSLQTIGRQETVLLPFRKLSKSCSIYAGASDNSDNEIDAVFDEPENIEPVCSVKERILAFNQGRSFSMAKISICDKGRNLNKPETPVCDKGRYLINGKKPMFDEGKDLIPEGKSTCDQELESTDAKLVCDKGEKFISEDKPVCDKGRDLMTAQTPVCDKGRNLITAQTPVCDKGRNIITAQTPVCDKGRNLITAQTPVCDKGRNLIAAQAPVCDKGRNLITAQTPVCDKGKIFITAQTPVCDKGRNLITAQTPVCDKGINFITAQTPVCDKGRNLITAQTPVGDKGEKFITEDKPVCDKGRNLMTAQTPVCDKGRNVITEDKKVYGSGMNLTNDPSDFPSEEINDEEKLKPSIYPRTKNCWLPSYQKNNESFDSQFDRKETPSKEDVDKNKKIFSAKPVLHLPLIRPSLIPKPTGATPIESPTYCFPESPKFSLGKLNSPLSEKPYESVYSDRFRRGRSFDLPSPRKLRSEIPIKDISGHLEITHGENDDSNLSKPTVYPRSPDTVNFDLEIARKLTQQQEDSLDLPEIADGAARITKSKAKKRKGKSKIPQRQNSRDSKEISEDKEDVKEEPKVVSEEVVWDFDDRKDQSFLDEERKIHDSLNGKSKESGDSGSESDSKASPRKHPILCSPGKGTIGSSSGSDVALHEGAELSPDDIIDVVGADGLRQSMQNILDQFMNEERRFDNQ